MTGHIEIPYRSAEQRWQAVLDRDPAADGRFVYGVFTTGVYCRPVCPSRRPHRANVGFFADAAAARRAGLRPCRRCAPDRPTTGTAGVEAVRRACAMIEDAETPPRLADLADAVGLSPFHFHRLFKSVLGVTPKDYADAHRLGRLRRELADGEPVAQAIYGAGFGSASRVYEAADAALGMTPARFKAGGAGVTIRYTVSACPLGLLLVAATERGIAAIEFDDSADRLVDLLRRRFPKAVLIEAESELASWVADLVAFIERPRHSLDLPLDVQGTAFQHQVWKVLKAIPMGETRSYADVAADAGRPGAARAVARACASNPTALAVPCHRVVRGDGGLSGYRWGVRRKRQLLDREAAAASEPATAGTTRNSNT